jgi:uncharacterized protein YecA (UPF0149 family)
MADVYNGKIYTDEQLKAIVAGLKRQTFNPNVLATKGQQKPSPLTRIMEMKVPPTPDQMKREPPRVGRHEPCPCGSGDRFNECCMGRRPVNAIADGW